MSDDKGYAPAAQMLICFLFSGERPQKYEFRRSLIKMGKFLKLPSGRLSKLADHQRKEALKRNLEDPPKPLFRDVRELILSKCAPEKQKQMPVIFEKQPFGELERLVTQKLLDVVKKIAKNELQSEKWLHKLRNDTSQHSRVSGY